MQAMSDEEAWDFISVPGRTGKLATVTPSGQPHCVPVWCTFRDGSAYFMTMHNTAKAKNIASNDKVMLTFDSETFPYDFVSLVGNAVVEEVSAEDLLEIATEIAARYVPKEEAQAFGRRNAVPGELLIKVSAQRFISAKQVAA